MTHRDRGLAVSLVGVAGALVGYLADGDYLMRLGIFVAAVGLVMTALALIRGTDYIDDSE